MEELRRLYVRLAADAAVREFYDRFPRNRWWSEGNRTLSTTLIQQAATTEELVREMQRSDLFCTNSEGENRRLAVEWLIGKYREAGLDIFALPEEIQESAVSYEGNCITCGGRRLSVDFFRSLGGAWSIQKLIQKERSPMRVVELGGGLGHLARVLRLMGVARSHVILDLPETLIFSYSFLTWNFPDAKALFVASEAEAKSASIDGYDFVFVPSCFAHLVNFQGAELFVNTASLGEMRNETIRYWINFLHETLPVKYFFVQNRFLNTIDPAHTWRWNENESSLRFDHTWTILGWDLEPTWFRCPYVASASSRQLEIAATREQPLTVEAAESRSRVLLEEVRAQDWHQLASEAPYMRVRHNQFVTDVTMSGTLFKLWESIRLFPTDEAVCLMLKYLPTVRRDSRTVFEEERYCEDLFLSLVTEQSAPEILDFAQEVRQRRNSEPEQRIAAELAGSTRDFNVVAVELAPDSYTGAAKTSYIAISKSLGTVDVLSERIGERDLPPLVLRAANLDEAIARASALEQPEVEFFAEHQSYNVVRTSSGYVALARALGPTRLFQESLGERDLAPVLFTATTYESLCGKIAAAEQICGRVAECAPAEQAEEGPNAESVLLGSYRGFNLVSYRQRIYAARQSLGPVDLRADERELEARFGAEHFVAAASTDIAKLHVDRVEASREVAEILAALAAARAAADAEAEHRNLGVAQLAGLRAEIEAVNREIAAVRAGLQSEADARAHGVEEMSCIIRAEIEAVHGEIAAVRAGLQSETNARVHGAEEVSRVLESRAEERSREMAALRAERESQCRHLNEESNDLRRMLTRAMEANQGEFDQLRSGIARLEVATRGELEALQSDVRVVSGDHASLRAEFALARYGPGSPDSPCLVGEHRGFALVHYRGCVYALRRPIDILEVPKGEFELISRYGQEGVVVAESVDSVRARIDLLEDLREIRAELASFEKQLRAGAFNLDQALQRMDEAIKVQEHKFQDLVRSWPNRLARIFSH